MFNEEEISEQRKQRVAFSKAFKRAVLLKFADGEKANDILPFNSNDLKYSSKLIHKWKKELYADLKMTSTIFENIQPENYQKEIDEIGENEEIDEVLPEITKIKNVQNTPDINFF